jgi:hypothetical protein
MPGGWTGLCGHGFSVMDFKAVKFARFAVSGAIAPAIAKAYPNCKRNSKT